MSGFPDLLSLLIQRELGANKAKGRIAQRLLDQSQDFHTSAVTAILHHPFERNLRDLFLRFEKVKNYASQHSRLSLKFSLTDEQKSCLASVIVPGLQDDFYLNLLDWSSTDRLALGVEETIFIWRPLDDIFQRGHRQDNSELFSDGEESDVTMGDSNFFETTEVTSVQSASSPSSERQHFSQIPKNAQRLILNDSREGSCSASTSTSMSVTAVAWEKSKTGHLLAVGRRCGHVELWDINTGDIIHVFEGHKSRVGTLDWFGPVLTSGSRDKLILHYDARIPRGVIFKWERHKQEVCGVRWSPFAQGGGSQQGLLASGGNDNKVYIWQLGQDKPILKLWDHSAAVKALSWSPHCSRFLVTGGGTNDRRLRLWDIKGGSTEENNSPSWGVSDSETEEGRGSLPRAKLYHCIETGSQICNLLWSPITSELVSTHGFTLNQVALWKLTPTSEVSTIDGRFRDGFAINQVGQLQGHDARVLYACMRPEGDVVATAAGDGTLKFWPLLPPETIQASRIAGKHSEGRRRSFENERCEVSQEISPFF